jgi:hypothetical protein
MRLAARQARCVRRLSLECTAELRGMSTNALALAIRQNGGPRATDRRGAWEAQGFITRKRRTMLEHCLEFFFKRSRRNSECAAAWASRYVGQAFAIEAIAECIRSDLPKDPVVRRGRLRQ